MSLTFEPERIDIADSGEIATDMGVVKLGHTVPSVEKRVEIAKHLVVWLREKNKWKVLYDCWNYQWPAR